MNNTIDWAKLPVSLKKKLVGALLKGLEERGEVPVGLHTMRFRVEGDAVLKSSAEFTQEQTNSIPWTVVVSLLLERVPALKVELLDCVRTACAMKPSERKATKDLGTWEQILDEVAGTHEVIKRRHDVVSVDMAGSTVSAAVPQEVVS